MHSAFDLVAAALALAFLVGVVLVLQVLWVAVASRSVRPLQSMRAGMAIGLLALPFIATAAWRWW